MTRFCVAISVVAFCLASFPSFAQDATKPAEPDPAKTPAMVKDVADAKAEVAKAAADATTAAHKYSDIAWMLTATALVMFMMPGLALFYGGMARRKNVLGTMMHTMVALGLVGVQWVVIGYSLAFGEPLYSISISKDDKGEPINGGLVGYSKELVCLNPMAAHGTTEDAIYAEKKIDKAKASDAQKKEVERELAKRNKFKTFPNTNLPLYLHAMFQGMFAIITVALVSGAFAERVKFSSYLLFSLLWTTIVYDPLAHMVWSFDWNTKVDVALTDPKVQIAPAAGLMGINGAIDFAGGTVVHIAAGFSGLAAILVLRKRIGYGKTAFHPNSMVLTLLGAGMLWFGWFGFNGGSALYSNGQSVSAFTVTQCAAAMAGLTWTLVEWIHKGKPTALGFASGLVAGLVAITPASGFVAPGGALIIGLAAGVLCYGAVYAKGLLGYDDSLDAFGIHGIGGFVGAILTAAFVSLPLWAYGAEMPEGAFPGKTIPDEVAKTITYDMSTQLLWQLKACLISAGYAFLATVVLVLIIDKTIGFTTKPQDEAMGLDLSEHGEVGFDFGGGALDEIQTSPVPKAAMAPPNGKTRRFTVVVDGVEPKALMTAWSALCQAGDKPPSPAFLSVYPYVTTVTGNKFRFRGGDPVELRAALKKLLESAVPGSTVTTHVDA